MTVFMLVKLYNWPRSKEDKNKKWDTYKSAYALYESQELTLNN